MKMAETYPNLMKTAVGGITEMWSPGGPRDTTEHPAPGKDITFEPHLDESSRAILGGKLSYCPPCPSL